MSEADLRLAFPAMDKLPPNPANMHTVCVHGECTLLLDMINITTTTVMLLEIGVSKSSCFMCRESTTAVQKVYRHITVLVSSGHSKYVAGWSLPRSAPGVLRELMGKRVMGEMDDVLRRARWKRKFARANKGGMESMPCADQVAGQVRESGGEMFSLG